MSGSRRNDVATRRKPGLWHSARKVEVEDVKPAHSKKCDVCGVQPTERRLVVTSGSGRHQTKTTLCIDCGVEWLKDRGEEVKRAVDFLKTGEGEIRL